MSVRRAVALALSAALGITGLTATTAPAATAASASDTPYDVTIAAPADPAGTPDTRLVGAGTGVLLMRDGEIAHPSWQSLEDGRVAHGPVCPSSDPIIHGDRVACLSSFGDEVTVHDFGSGASYSWAIGSEQRSPDVAADRLITTEFGNDGGVVHLLGYGPDAPADLDVLVPGAVDAPGIISHDDAGALITYADATSRHNAMLDFATGTLTPVPTVPFAMSNARTVLSADWIVVYDESGTDRAFVVSRTDQGDPGRTVKLPNDRDDVGARLGVVGDWIVGHYDGPVDGYEFTTVPVVATPIAGGDTRDLGIVTPSGAGVETGADGALYLMGGTDYAHWGVRRVSPGADGAPVTSQALAAPPTVPYTAVTMANGRVVTETRAGTHTLRGFGLSLAGAHTPSQAWTCDGLSGTAANCPSILNSSGSAGAWWHDTGDGRLVTLDVVNRPASGGQPSCSDCAVQARVTTPGSAGTTRTVTLAYAGKLQSAFLYGVSGRHAHFRGTTDSGTRSIVADIETGKILRDSAAGTGQALWGGRLWTASATDDTVSAIDLRTGATVETLDLGTDCRPFSLQVVGRWIYSRCSSGSTDAAVYDREKKVSVDVWVPSNGEPRLGDGFLAHASYGTYGYTLTATDVRSGEPEDRELGVLAYDNVQDENEVWTVDRFGGAVAFVDSLRKVHVSGLGGATTRLTAIDYDTPAANLKSAPWKPRWWLSKPAASWTLSLKHKATGKVVRTLTGGEARGLVAPSWDGKDAVGKLVANGAYTWTLTAKAADAQGADLSVTGAVAVSGGAAVRRDLAGSDGFGDLVVMDTAGLVSMYRGTGTGTLSGRIAGTGTKFATTSVFIPMGDLNGDRCADVYVRVGDQLRAYRPGCDKVVSASSPYTLVSAGWGPYDVLTSSGDVNGDGYADLIARQASSGDVYFYAGTADHRLKARVRIGVNWKPYKKIVGAGDLNGDGRGDLLGVDAYGVMWRYYGTATGGVSARVKLGGGWSAFSSLVGVGDLSGDGRADLLARDTAGRLFAYKSTGTGLYVAGVMIGSGGWNGFKGLY
ncbi:FG-GAP-like repeat-containing protein [Streptomyces sp. NBC_00094]|uniref:FG-GAP-like repeat-containing protein n=1 Tax=Streptomyces sp. NBC_00094 TaxID=2903620 RepID=UPI002251F2FD|nr:FG-GAP-like repeat-containing protein [Streptomyces sp. NBC_00094]MCX5392253.1 FG-GAP-like repeat-containing protein [Streptomyces sp. NBC_00094]